jgi:hypothetical protein
MEWKAMTTLSARYVRRPQQRYVCDYCERAIIGPYIRLYGNGEHEPMWTLRLHPTEACCPSATRDPKVQAALAKASDQ